MGMHESYELHKVKTRKIVLLFSLFFIAVVMVISYISSLSKVQFERAKIKTSLMEHTNEIALEWHHYSVPIYYYVDYFLKHESTGNVLSDIESYTLSVEDSFIRALSNDPTILQMRILDTEGNEVLRYENGESPVKIPTSELQNKYDRYYFKESMKLDNGEIFVSSIDLNIENSEIQIPLLPVIRFSIPLFLDDEIKGVLVVNQEYNSLFGDIYKKHFSMGHNFELLIISDSGDFILNTMDPEDIFSSEFGEVNLRSREFIDLDESSNYFYSDEFDGFIYSRSSQTVDDALPFVSNDSSVVVASIMKSSESVYVNKYSDFVTAFMPLSFYSYLLPFLAATSIILLLVRKKIIHGPIEIIEQNYLYLIMSICDIAENVAEGGDEVTGKHNIRLGVLSEFLAQKLHVSKKLVKYIKFYAPLHDIGKSVIDHSILSKPGKLTFEEFELMKKHTEYGYMIIKDIGLGSVAENIIKYHHEYWDGSGYNGLIENKIPLEARIVTIVDIYDALRNKRPYKPEMTHNESLKIIKNEDGKKLDPEILRVFIKYEKELEKLFHEFH